jgi:poly-beta-1,6-N-acetyl-D-glucosamine synthase
MQQALQIGRIAGFLTPFYAFTALIFYLALTTDYVPIFDHPVLRFAVLLLFAPILIKYLLHLVIASMHPIAENFRLKRNRPDAVPSVSVLIPAWNEEVGIVATIESVLRTHYPKLEIVVVNDGSTDRTHRVVKDFLARRRARGIASGVPIRYRRLTNGGKAKALNAAVAIAKGEIVVTIDADSVMHRRAIHNLVRHFEDPRVASVAGSVVIGNRRKPLGFLQQLEYLYGFYFKRADSMLDAVYIVGGAAAAYRAAVIRQLGGYDEDIITEDIELSTRLQDRGYAVRYAPDAIVYTEGPSDILGLCRQRLRWKYGRLLTFIKYRHLFFSASPQHNRYLTFFILPIALFAEFLLFFEGFMLLLFYWYTFATNDYLPLLVAMLVIAGVVVLQIASDPKPRYHLNLLALAPVAWAVFYIMDMVEYQALIRSIQRLISKEKVLWQKWVRAGVFAEKA